MPSSTMFSSIGYKTVTRLSSSACELGRGLLMGDAKIYYFFPSVSLGLCRLNILTKT